MNAGFALLPLSAVIGAWMGQEIVFYVLAAIAILLSIGGWLLVLKKGVCPKCGQYLGQNFPRAIGRVPAYCPHCGEKL